MRFKDITSDIRKICLTTYPPRPKPVGSPVLHSREPVSADSQEVVCHFQRPIDRTSKCPSLTARGPRAHHCWSFQRTITGATDTRSMLSFGRKASRTESSVTFSRSIKVLASSSLIQYGWSGWNSKFLSFRSVMRFPD